MASLPPFAPFPLPEWRANLPLDDWTTCQVAWSTLATAYIALPAADLKAHLSKDPSAYDFLQTFMQEVARDGPSILTTSSPSTPRTLLHATFQLTSTLLQLPSSSSSSPSPLLTWTFLADLSKVHGKKRTAPVLSALSTAPPFETEILSLKRTLTRSLELGIKNSELGVLQTDLARLNHLIHASPDAAALFLAGSDFVDALVNCYTLMNPPLRKVLVATTYLCLIGLTEGEKPRFAMLADQLYALKSLADAHRAGPLRETDSLVVDLVSSTPLLKQTLNKAEQASVSVPSTLKARITALEDYKRPGYAAPRRQGKMLKRRDKGKGKAVSVTIGGAGGAGYGDSEMHVHLMSAISQVQELFPDLGSGFVARLLEEFGDDPEVVVARLLEDDLPPELADADRSETLPEIPAKHSVFPPSPTPPVPERRNLYDDDDLDRLAHNTANLHLGKRNPGATADALLQDRSTAPAKSAILSALAAFHSDDDERDDTYDADDVGGAVEATNEEADGDQRAIEEALYRAYQADPSVFGRETAARESEAREKLRGDTGMADEAIEGWAVLLERSPALRQRLENTYTSFSGEQEEIASSKWRAGDDGEGGDGGGPSFRGGRGRGRGRGGRGRGGADNVKAGGENTEAARRRKEANKASRANHNRRDQRARKMARGGGFAG